jgi:hypothetical protein
MVIKKDDYGVVHWVKRHTSVLAQCREIDVHDTMLTEHFRVLHSGVLEDVTITCVYCIALFGMSS